MGKIRKEFREILMEYERQDGEFEPCNIIIPFNKINDIVVELLTATQGHEALTTEDEVGWLLRDFAFVQDVNENGYEENIVKYTEKIMNLIETCVENK